MSFSRRYQGLVSAAFPSLFLHCDISGRSLKHPRTVVEVGVRSLRRINPKSGEVRFSASADALALESRATGTR